MEVVGNFSELKKTICKKNEIVAPNDQLNTGVRRIQKYPDGSEALEQVDAHPEITKEKRTLL